MDKLNKNFRGMIQYSNSSIEFNDTEMLGIIFNMVDEYNKSPKKLMRTQSMMLKTASKHGVQ